MSSLGEKVGKILKDIQWVISVAKRPEEAEFKLTTRFLLLLVFVVGVFQFVFHIAGVYLTSFIYRQPLAALGNAVAESIAVFTTMAAILAAMMYLLFKLR
ncbi:MAG: hypothetical protein ACK4M3_05685 [Pyrobaculum sp.]